MSSRRAVILVGAALFMVVAGAVVVAWMLLTGRPASLISGEPAAATAATPGRTIKARLFYVSPDGLGLTGVEREVPFAEGAEQAREIVNAQIAPAAEPLVSAVPPGTALRAVFVTERGDAYVDLSKEAATAHPGGTMNELLTVYTIVNALTINIPAVQSVQILIDGKEVVTLAGHVDLRRPLAKNLSLVQ